MAGKNEVVLTFAGDSKQLERATTNASTALSKLEGDIDGTSSTLSRLDRAIGDGGRKFGDYGTGLAGVGDRADEVDTRMMGLSDGIQGVTDLMGGNGQLRAHEYAMAFSDLGSAMYNTVIPSLQDGLKSIKNMSIGTLAAGAGIAALAGGLIYMGIQSRDSEVDVSNLTKALEENDRAANELVQTGIETAMRFEKVDDIFKKLLEESPQLADEFIEQAEAAGVNSDEIEDMEKQLAKAADTESYLADQIRGVNDALQAQSDPVFAVIDAQNQVADAAQAVADAEAAVNDAVTEFGANSPQHEEALQALERAQQDVVAAGLDMESSLLSLGEAMVDQGFKVDDVIAHMQGMVGQNGITQASVDAVAASLRGVPGSVESTLQAHDLASGTIGTVLTRLFDLDGRSANVTVTATGRWLWDRTFGGMFRSGGTVAASGGVRTGRVLVGEEGPELVDLPSGSFVHPAHRTAQMMRRGGGGGGGGGTVVNVYVQGSVLSERELVGVVTRAVDSGRLAL